MKFTGDRVRAGRFELLEKAKQLKKISQIEQKTKSCLLHKGSLSVLRSKSEYNRNKPNYFCKTNKRKRQ